ncbi:lanthionine synthetase C family protein [Actinomadura sp. SCN-SB]|uniref:lanthionine synthetase C family protein n=1 Tax=Actinomadura sp. SCN-SB TaxID=3373092 RepID=UPI00375184F1
MTAVESPPLTQSLARGTAGTALLHIERAHADASAWREAHAWVQAAARGEVIVADQAGLYYGAPAIAFLLHAAQTDGVPRYGSASRTINAHVEELTRRRVAAALARIDSGQAATFGEYDLFYGLTGLGALLLRQAPHADVLRAVLGYLVRLTRPHRTDIPGWWVNHDPDPILPTPGGHANLGMAHGAAGILALLSLAAHRGVLVDGQHEIIHDLCRWFDRWQRDGSSGPWWPQWISRTELATGRLNQSGLHRPSWCYGTPGIARALQLAAKALGDAARQRNAEDALAASVTDRAQLQAITEPGLCHGAAGLYQTTWRAARDAITPAISQALPHLADMLQQRADQAHTDTSFLDGTTGVALASLTLAHPDHPPRSGWDACLLLV